MSESYESIPPERRDEFLQKAKEVVDLSAESVVNPAIEALGELVVKEAEQITALDAEGSGLGDEAEKYVQDNDFNRGVMDELTQPPENPIGEQAQKWLDMQNAFEEASKNRADMKYDFRKFATMEDAQKAADNLALEQQISSGSDEEIRDLTADNKRHIQDNKVSGPTSSKDFIQEVADKAGRYDFMSQRREYIPPSERADLSGAGFDRTKNLLGQIGLQNQLWSTMAEQQKSNPPSNPPEAPQH